MTTSQPDHAFEALLEYLKRSRGFDFTGYKRATLMRRVAKRMHEAGVTTYADYLDYLEVHPEEFARLFNTILINVTSFFRDQPVWDFVSSNVLPRILASKRSGDPIRLWSAGCASGEEAYSLAICLAEQLGIEELRDRVKIYATDVDEEALTRARHATYSATEVASVPERLLETYFERTDSRYIVRKDVRRVVIFGRHDLIQDAPISRIDLLMCRNTLMYFNAETQSRILTRFHFALPEGRFLVLGRAEMLFSQASAFIPLDLKLRVFTRGPRSASYDRLLFAMNGNGDTANGGNGQDAARMLDASFDASPVAQVVVDLNNTLVLANERARLLFGLTARDIGRPIQDLELSYRPVELRPYIEQAYGERRSVLLREVAWPAGLEERWIEVQIAPLTSAGGAPLGAHLVFTDITRYRRLQNDLERANRDLETAYEELQSTNEELETTNEELQSTVEELETTNEELQSTVEELETMNEELQSTNEELQAANEELRRQSDTLNEANSLMESVLASLRGGVVVVDRELHVMVWNAHSQELWGLRADEVVGRHFMSLDSGLPATHLWQAMRRCLSGESEVEEASITAINRRGQPFRCLVTITPLRDPARDIHGSILLMQPVDEAID